MYVHNIYIYEYTYISCVLMQFTGEWGGGGGDYWGGVTIKDEFR